MQDVTRTQKIAGPAERTRRTAAVGGASQETVAAGRRRGRPRSERTRDAIMRAAGELMLERDVSEISVDALAERAGASKATIYRWWRSKELLLLDALRSEWESTAPEDLDCGSLAEDLCALVVPWARELTAKPYGRTIAAFVARAQTDAGFAHEYRSEFVRYRRAPARKALERAIERGEIRADSDLEAALDLIYGPLYHRLLHGHAPLTEDFARTVVDYAVAALGTPEERRP
jgi:AcrR family transcriptional regulator